MIEIRGANSVAEVDAALALVDIVLGAQRGWQATRERAAENFRADPDLMSIAVDKGRLVGALGCDASGHIGPVAVDGALRRRGVGRQLMERSENLLRSRGATEAGLGSVDGAVDFYLSCGYVPQLLVQFAPEAEDPARLISELLSGVLSGREIFQTEWNGHPQLWLQDRDIDWDLKRRIEAVGTGVVAQYIMSKRLTDAI
jgi:GNAT superfamily N-acetyltransferase